jgi:hypothetical protein
VATGAGVAVAGGAAAATAAGYAGMAVAAATIVLLPSPWSAEPGACRR